MPKDGPHNTNNRKSRTRIATSTVCMKSIHGSIYNTRNVPVSSRSLIVLRVRSFDKKHEAQRGRDRDREYRKKREHGPGRMRNMNMRPTAVRERPESRLETRVNLT